jgi:hypothetical protein
VLGSTTEGLDRRLTRIGVDRSVQVGERTALASFRASLFGRVEESPKLVGVVNTHTTRVARRGVIYGVLMSVARGASRVTTSGA